MTNVLELLVVALFAREKKCFKNQSHTHKKKKNSHPQVEDWLKFMEAHTHHFMYDRSVTIKKNDMNLHAVIWKEFQGMISIF